VIVAAYTANLASTMTNSGKPVPLFGSIDEVISNKMAACTDPSYAQQGTLESMFDTLNFENVGGQNDIAQALLDGTCSSAIAPRNDFDHWATQSEFCELSMVGPSLVFATAGWVTSTKAAACIQRPIELAIHLLQASGELGEMYSNWIPVSACAEEGAESTSTRRRLKNSGSSRSHGRRLKGGQNAAAASSGGADEGQMGVEDFTGLFVLWLSGTALALIVSASKGAFACLKRKRQRAHDRERKLPRVESLGEEKVTAFSLTSTPAVLPEVAGPLPPPPQNFPVTTSTEDVGHSWDKKPIPTLLDTVFGRNADTIVPHFDPNLDINNNSAMLRYLIKLADDSRREEQRTAGEVHALWQQLAHSKKSMEA